MNNAFKNFWFAVCPEACSFSESQQVFLPVSLSGGTLYQAHLRSPLLGTEACSFSESQQVFVPVTHTGGMLCSGHLRSPLLGTLACYSIMLARIHSGAHKSLSRMIATPESDRLPNQEDAHTCGHSPTKHCTEPDGALTSGLLSDRPYLWAYRMYYK